MIQNTLKERGNKYGAFSDNANTCQSIKELMRKHDAWSDMSPYQMEALDMIAHKLARILNGDPYYIDSWHDIAGYATLVENILQGEQFDIS